MRKFYAVLLFVLAAVWFPVMMALGECYHSTAEGPVLSGMEITESCAVIVNIGKYLVNALLYILGLGIVGGTPIMSFICGMYLWTNEKEDKK